MMEELRREMRQIVMAFVRVSIAIFPMMWCLLRIFVLQKYLWDIGKQGPMLEAQETECRMNKKSSE